MAEQHPVQKRYSRRTLPPATHGQDFGYGACSIHTPYPSKTQARRSAQRHAQRYCLKCSRGQVLNLWQCVYGSGHWHTGHGYPQPSEGS